MWDPERGRWVLDDEQSPTPRRGRRRSVEVIDRSDDDAGAPDRYLSPEDLAAGVVFPSDQGHPGHSALTGGRRSDSAVDVSSLLSAITERYEIVRPRNARGDRNDRNDRNGRDDIGPRRGRRRAPEQPAPDTIPPTPRPTGRRSAETISPDSRSAGRRSADAIAPDPRSAGRRSADAISPAARPAGRRSAETIPPVPDVVPPAPRRSGRRSAETIPPVAERPGRAQRGGRRRADDDDAIRPAAGIHTGGRHGADAYPDEYEDGYPVDDRYPFDSDDTLATRHGRADRAEYRDVVAEPDRRHRPEALRGTDGVPGREAAGHPAAGPGRHDPRYVTGRAEYDPDDHDHDHDHGHRRGRPAAFPDDRGYVAGGAGYGQEVPGYDTGAPGYGQVEPAFDHEETGYLTGVPGPGQEETGYLIGDPGYVPDAHGPAGPEDGTVRSPAPDTELLPGLSPAPIPPDAPAVTRADGGPRRRDSRSTGRNDVVPARRRRWPWVAGAVTAGTAAVLAGFAVFGGFGGFGGSDEGPGGTRTEGTAASGTVASAPATDGEQPGAAPAVDAAAEPAAAEVTFEVTGSGTADTITVGRGTSVTQVTGADLPWDRTSPAADEPTDYSVSATGGSGEISCRILVDGAVISEESAEGNFSAVSCSGNR
ncbi:hypothetical protein Pdca_21110 [Pseudonocardia autotrophica]|nr:hypothetical protein Pdca_21110 [Pseudonocardia autotrophica]